jgi:hypothetical protein
MKFLRWLFPTWFTAKCRHCGEVKQKRQMVQWDDCGWFCDQEEFEEFREYSIVAFTSKHSVRGNAEEELEAIKQIHFKPTTQGRFHASFDFRGQPVQVDCGSGPRFC